MSFKEYVLQQFSRIGNGTYTGYFSLFSPQPFAKRVNLDIRCSFFISGDLFPGTNVSALLRSQRAQKPIVQTRRKKLSVKNIISLTFSLLGFCVNLSMGASTVNCYITKQEVVNNRLSASLSLSSRRFILSWFFLFALRFSLKFFPGKNTQMNAKSQPADNKQRVRKQRMATKHNERCCQTQGCIRTKWQCWPSLCE